MKALLVATVLLAAASARAQGYTRRVAIVLYDRVELLDFAGPAEVFAAAAQIGAGEGGAPAFEVFTVARTREPIVSQGFLRVTPDHDITTAPPSDIIVLPGGGTGGVMADPVMMRWVTERARAAKVTVTVCTGATILAKAGLLDGRDVTTWYGAIDFLRELAPRARVHEGRRFVDTGNIITTAGVSAGIDGALHLVARLLGRHVADETARYMEYAWAPPAYVAKYYSTWNPSLDERGRRMQQVRAMTDERRWDDAESGIRALLRERDDDGAAWYQLGVTLHAAGRLDAAIAAHKRATEFAAQKPRALYNLGCAYALKKQPDDAVRELEGAVAAGFSSADALMSDDDLVSLRDDPRFQKLVASLRRR